MQLSDLFVDEILNPERSGSRMNVRPGFYHTPLSTDIPAPCGRDRRLLARAEMSRAKTPR